jgi:hypothetical protein
MDHKEYRLQVWGTMIALFGVVGALAGGTVAYLDYRSKPELGALRALHDAQLATCRDASLAAARLLAATSQEDFERVLLSFGEIKHGPALALLDRPVLDQMIFLWNDAINFESSEKGWKFSASATDKLGMEVFKVSSECRKSLVRGFEAEANSPCLAPRSWGL